MKLKIENTDGHIIIDDNTGKILSILVINAIEGKFDSRSFSSYSNNSDGTHTAINFDSDPTPTKQQEQDLWDEEELNKRMNIIGQNGNTGEHYD